MAEHARAAQQRGELILGGALADPVDGAVLLFDCDSASVVLPEPELPKIRILISRLASLLRLPQPSSTAGCASA